MWQITNKFSLSQDTLILAVLYGHCLPYILHVCHLTFALSLINTIISMMIKLVLNSDWLRGIHAIIHVEYQDFVGISLDWMIVECYCRWKLSNGNLYTFIRPKQETVAKNAPKVHFSQLSWWGL
jgi:hypothetical protein